MPNSSYQPGGLVAGDFPVAMRKVTILSGQELERGSVLGRITDSDKYQLTASAAADGSQVPSLVLAVDVDASGGDVVAPAYASGEFAADQLKFGADHDADSVEAAFRIAGLPIFVRTRA
ncbi:conserved hypothetical protein [Roseibium sp. TrichSKD4]|uniref:head decoration protein n=1 Tax=Roseibium sp. TrichSKD4 TaxID=744980 RepID=UPI0001E5638C|nr:head decoration protein [Roseibium sp. TrichSKD4]EFO33910.1 conserved hypothetical protein [Roseibium sp. TrichSKD4]